MLAGKWENEREEWLSAGTDPRPPVFILVCKNTRIAKVIYDWLANDEAPTGIPPAKIGGFRNRNGEVNTIRVDSRVVHETDTGKAKSESRWMRVGAKGALRKFYPAKPQSSASAWTRRTTTSWTARSLKILEPQVGRTAG